jgi:hypothetical protein
MRKKMIKEKMVQGPINENFGIVPRLLIVMYNYDTWVQDLTCLAYYRASTSNKLTPNAPTRA